MKILASVVSAITAATLFGAMLWLGSATPSRAAPTPTPQPRLFVPGEMPEYPGVFETSLGEALSLNGVPLRVSTFVTGHSPERVVRHYRAELARRFVAPTEQWSADGCVLSLVLPGSGTTRTVVVRREGNLTRVFAALLPFTASPVRLFPAPNGEAPYGPVSLAALEVADGGGSRRGRTAIFQEAARVEVVRARIREWMAAHQWNPVQDYAGSDELQFYRPGERALVRLKSFKASAPMTSIVYQASSADE